MCRILSNSFSVGRKSPLLERPSSFHFPSAAPIHSFANRDLHRLKQINYMGIQRHFLLHLLLYMRSWNPLKMVLWFVPKAILTDFCGAFPPILFDAITAPHFAILGAFQTTWAPDRRQRLIFGFPSTLLPLVFVGPLLGCVQLLACCYLFAPYRFWKTVHSVFIIVPIFRRFHHSRPYLVCRACASMLFFFCRCYIRFFLTERMVILTIRVIL